MTQKYFQGHSESCCTFKGSTEFYSIFTCIKHPGKIIYNSKYILKAGYDPFIKTKEQIIEVLGEGGYQEISSLIETNAFGYGHSSICCQHLETDAGDIYYFKCNKNPGVILWSHKTYLNQTGNVGPCKLFEAECVGNLSFLQKYFDKPNQHYFTNHDAECCEYMGTVDSHAFFKCAKNPDMIVWGLEYWLTGEYKVLAIIGTPIEFITKYAHIVGSDFTTRVLKLFEVGGVTPTNPMLAHNPIPEIQSIDIQAVFRQQFKRKIKIGE